MNGVPRERSLARVHEPALVLVPAAVGRIVGRVSSRSGTASRSPVGPELSRGGGDGCGVPGDHADLSIVLEARR